MAQKQRDPWTDPESTEQKKKHFFVCFFRGFCMDFPGKQMGDGFSWESNGDCTDLGIKRGLQQNKKIIT